MSRDYLSVEGDSDKRVLVSGQLFRHLLNAANIDYLVQIRWGEPRTDNVTIYEPAVTIILKDPE